MSEEFASTGTRQPVASRPRLSARDATPRPKYTTTSGPLARSRSSTPSSDSLSGEIAAVAVISSPSRVRVARDEIDRAIDARADRREPDADGVLDERAAVGLREVVEHADADRGDIAGRVRRHLGSLAEMPHPDLEVERARLAFFRKCLD